MARGRELFEIHFSEAKSAISAKVAVGSKNLAGRLPSLSISRVPRSASTTNGVVAKTAMDRRQARAKAAEMAERRGATRRVPRAINRPIVNGETKKARQCAGPSERQTARMRNGMSDKSEWPSNV
ncbi:MAG: hypothetical protein ACREHD_31600, partial [Pirellulales bacterium]